MIVTIDGPAGAGKSRPPGALARRLGFRFLDTGAMYRAVALAAKQRSVALDDASALARLAGEIHLEVTDDRVLLDGVDVTSAIRRREITQATHYAADNPGVRQRLVELQRRIAAQGNFVAEGRDRGTVAFPNAQAKIFLTASPEERARRRLKELEAQGEGQPIEEVLTQQNIRDARDASRAVGPLVRAADAVEFVTDGLTADEVVDRLEQIVRQRMPRG